MSKREYIPIIAVFGMWAMIMLTGTSTPDLGSVELLILCYVITAPLLIALILSLRAIHRDNKAEKE